jgi:hypothetical protein
MFEPNISCEQIEFSIAVDINCRHAFGIFEGGFAGCTSAARENLDQRPVGGIARVGRNFGEENLLSALVPKCELRFASSEKIAEDLIVVLGSTTFFYCVAFLGNCGIEFWIRTFPPPDFIALPITAEGEVEIAVAINVKNGSACFDCEKVGFNDQAGPSCGARPIPDERRGDCAEAENEIVSSVFVEIGNDCASLLGGWARDWEIAGGTGEMAPVRLGGISSNCKKQRNGTGEQVHREAHEVTRSVGELESCQPTGISATTGFGPEEMPVIEIALS